ncbi:MAG: chemotaxis protein CheR [Actinobacteria bacterium 13_1_20CM_3_71_11]|nr:MAG: chemotaxis protein CheR [Actinobacteria bacterium 13_1_20CM_3_71_11]TML31873.1 MAG: protein-glutamate O-methyltransferase CheR [Actinomycetota bacterium]
MSLSEADFAYVAGLVRRESAIVLSPGKEYLVEARLLPVARQAGAASLADFLDALQRRPDPAVHRCVVDALTTNETSWFRDREPYTALSGTVLPELVSARTATRTLRIWSAACSSGQEPYSLAMTVQQDLPAGWRYHVTATDISTEMIGRARSGEYSQVEVNRGLPAPLLARFFTPSGTGWRISPALRENVTFQQMNLAAPLPSMAPFDVIFLRNILIYFDVETKRTVLRNVGRLLRPDGYLFLGAAETTIGVDDSFERVAIGRTSAYRPRVPVPANTGGNR